MEICTCHYKENLEWLKESPWVVNVVHKEGGDPFPQEFTNWTIPNVGLEATSYLSYIVERYETLPDHVAFIHGHETAQHQLGDRPLLDMIRDANIKIHDFVPLNNYWQCIDFASVHVYLKEVLQRRSFVLEKEIVVDPKFIMCGGAQFIVSKERIRMNSLGFYKTLRDTVRTREDAVSLELIWHVIFGEAMNIVPRQDYFNPPVATVKYSPATLLPMRMCELKIKRISEPDPDFDNSGTTYFSSNEEQIKNISYEVARVREQDIPIFTSLAKENCLFFEKLYLEALETYKVSPPR
jgi:hypothetical protein